MHARTHIHTHAYTHTSYHTCTHTCIHTHPTTHAHTLHTHVHTHMHTCAHPTTHTHTHTHAYKHTLTTVAVTHKGHPVQSTSPKWQDGMSRAHSQYVSQKVIWTMQRIIHFVRSNQQTNKPTTNNTCLNESQLNLNFYIIIWGDCTAQVTSHERMHETPATKGS